MKDKRLFIIGTGATFVPRKKYAIYFFIAISLSIIFYQFLYIASIKKSLLDIGINLDSPLVYIIEFIIAIFLILPCLGLEKGTHWEVTTNNINYYTRTSTINDAIDILNYVFRNIYFAPVLQIPINQITSIEILANKKLWFGSIGYPISLNIVLKDESETSFLALENDKLIDIANYLESKNINIIDELNILDALNSKLNIDNYLAEKIENK